MSTFRDFMETSLYDPREGFYAVRRPREDFYTAPELHPAFASVLASEICERLKALSAAKPAEPLFIVEVGSGDGTLARQVLGAVREQSPAWLPRVRYLLVERVERLLLESIVALKDLGAKLLGYSRLEDVPRLCGVIFSNELYDALPFHVLEKNGGRVQEVYVERLPGGGTRERLGLISKRSLVHAARAVAPRLQEGGRHAVSLEARAWIRRMSGVLKAGSILTVDYGKRFPSGTPNPPRGFFRHSATEDLSARPGRQDLTASVDFSALIEEGERCGLKTVSFGTLGSFLLERGILSRLPAGDTAEAFAERSKVKTLFHPEGMGEAFKVLIQEKGLP